MICLKIIKAGPLLWAKFIENYIIYKQMETQDF